MALHCAIPIHPEELLGNARITEFPIKIGEVPLQGLQLLALELPVGPEEPMELLQGHGRHLIMGQLVPLEKGDVLGYGVPRDAQLRTDEPFARTRAI